MFSWFKKKAQPQPVAATPRVASPTTKPDEPVEMVRGKISFANGQRTWTEEFDVVEIVSTVLQKRGRFVTRSGDLLRLDTSGYLLRPVMVSFKPLDNGGAQTCTVIHVKHARLIPDWLFEYQHSTGSSVNDSIAKGIDQWDQVDLVTLLESLEKSPQGLMSMQMEFPPADDNPARTRRVLFGPVGHMAMKKPDPGEAAEEHSFCACCLLTNSIDAFKPFIESDDFVGIRLFAMRDAEGKPSADCRINGKEFEPGKQALREYVAKWPDRGMEFRKQYVVVQNARV